MAGLCLDFVHLGGVGEDVCELSVNCGWGFSAVGFQPRQCNISVGQPQHEVRRFRYVSNFCTKSRRLSRHGGQLFYYRSGSVRSECRHALASLIGDGFIALAVSDISMPFSEACCRSRLPFLTWRRAAHLKLATERRLEQFGREFIGRN